MVIPVEGDVLDGVMGHLHTGSSIAVPIFHASDRLKDISADLAGMCLFMTAPVRPGQQWQGWTRRDLHSPT